MRQVRLVYASDADEELLLAEIEVGGITCCQVLKREEFGPVMLAFFRPDSGEEILVDPTSFLAAVADAVKEIGTVRK